MHHILKCHFIKFIQSLQVASMTGLSISVSGLTISSGFNSSSGLNSSRSACEYNNKSCDFQQCNMLDQMNKIYVHPLFTCTSETCIIE